MRVLLALGAVAVCLFAALAPRRVLIVGSLAGIALFLGVSTNNGRWLPAQSGGRRAGRARGLGPGVDRQADPRRQVGGAALHVRARGRRACGMADGDLEPVGSESRLPRGTGLRRLSWIRCKREPQRGARFGRRIGENARRAWTTSWRRRMSQSPALASMPRGGSSSTASRSRFVSARPGTAFTRTAGRDRTPRTRATRRGRAQCASTSREPGGAGRTSPVPCASSWSRETTCFAKRGVGRPQRRAQRASASGLRPRRSRSGSMSNRPSRPRSSASPTPVSSECRRAFTVDTAMRAQARRAKALLRRLTADDERGVTAEHWGEEAREKAEGDDWQGLYWQSYILTAAATSTSAIAGDPDENWLHFTKQRFFRSSGERSRSASAAATASLERDGRRAGDRRALRGVRHLARGRRGGHGRRPRRPGTRRPDRLRRGRPEHDRARARPLRRGLRGRRRCTTSRRSSTCSTRSAPRSPPGGLFVVNEYVGPARFQFPDEHLPLMDGLLARCSRSRIAGASTTASVKAEGAAARRRRRSTTIDPSESVRSDEIMGLVEERFEIVYQRRLRRHACSSSSSADIAGNFDPADPQDVAMIDLDLPLREDADRAGRAAERLRVPGR